MNIDQKFSVITQSSEQSLALGNSLGRLLQLGNVVEFVGDLGGGKTTIIKGIAQGLGIEQTITSPTYNIQRSYKIPTGGTLEHYDLYRLGDDEILLQEMREIIEAADAIICVEWADHFRESLQDDRYVVEVHYLNGDNRRIEIHGTGKTTKERLTKLEYVA